LALVDPPLRVRLVARRIDRRLPLGFPTDEQRAVLGAVHRRRQQRMSVDHHHLRLTAVQGRDDARARRAEVNGHPQAHATTLASLTPGRSTTPGSTACLPYA